VKPIYVFHTRVGPFYICAIRPPGCTEVRYEAVFNDEGYGNYSRPDQAAEDLANNGTFSIMCNGQRLDTSRLGIPASVLQWERIA